MPRASQPETESFNEYSEGLKQRDHVRSRSTSPQEETKEIIKTLNEEEIFSIVRASLGLDPETRFKAKHGSQLDFKKLKCQAKVPSSRSFARVKFRNKATDRVLCVFVCQE